MIGEFLVELSEDPNLLAAYRGNQRKCLDERSGLSREQQDLLLTNDLKRIRKAVQDEYKKAEVIAILLPVQHVA
jgi:acetyl-CoA acetyltransferase